MPDLSIPYAHAWDTIKKGIDDRGPYYALSYWFDNWADSDKVANELAGYTTRVGDLTKRTPPHRFPLSPNLYCDGVVIEGVGAPILSPSGQVNYNGGFFAHVTYRAISMIVQQSQQDPDKDHQIDKDTPVIYCTQELDFETETYVHERAHYRWSTSDSLNNKRTDVPIKVSLGVTTMTFTFHELTYLPRSLIKKNRNKINDAKFLGSDLETILFVGGRTYREIGRDGTLAQKCTMVFKERDVSWNKFLRRDIVQWDYVQDFSANRMFQTADLSKLLQL
jgi:hypothetical protein